MAECERLTLSHGFVVEVAITLAEYLALSAACNCDRNLTYSHVVQQPFADSLAIDRHKVRILFVDRQIGNLEV